jgi:hypothetical protein
MQSQRAAEEKEIDIMDGDGGGDDQGGDEDSEGRDGDSEGGEGDRDSDETTDAGGERTDGTEDDTTNGRSTSAAKKKKAIRKDRNPPTLGTKREDFTAVNENDVPVEPKALATGYGTQIGCIIWETVTINMRNLQDPGNAHLVQLLL